jgi:hypothetical protein
MPVVGSQRPRSCARRTSQGDDRRAVRQRPSGVLGRRQRHQPSRCRDEARLRERWPAIRVIHTPTHASWLNQVELYFSVVQDKVLDPNQWTSPADIETALQAFGERYSAIATPFAWRFTRDDLRRVLTSLTLRAAA